MEVDDRETSRGLAGDPEEKQDCATSILKDSTFFLAFSASGAYN